MEYSREWHVSWHTSKIWHQAKYSISICTLSKALSGANQTKGDNINSALFHINMKLKSVQRDNEVRVEPWSKSRQCIIHALPLLLCKKGLMIQWMHFPQHIQSVWKNLKNVSYQIMASEASPFPIYSHCLKITQNFASLATFNETVFSICFVLF